LKSPKLALPATVLPGVALILITPHAVPAPARA
jgi:hypothetical protein